MQCAIEPQASRFVKWLDLVFRELGHKTSGFFEGYLAWVVLVWLKLQ